MTGQGEWRSNATFLSQGGWSYGVPLLSANEIFRVEKSYSCPVLTDYVFQDPSGGRHALGLASVDYVPNECPGDPSHEAGGDDVVRASLFDCGSTGLCGPVSIADADGTVYEFNSPNAHGSTGGYGASLPHAVEDRNGNVVTVTDNNSGAFTYTDTAGRAAISSSGFGTTGNTVTVSGLGGPYILTWGTAASAFSVEAANAGPNGNCRGISGTQLTNPVITVIELPNGEKYKFYYESTYGLLREIVFPTGGNVQYTWALNPEAELASFPDTQGADNGCVYKYGWPAVASRSVSFDGSTVSQVQTFSYSTAWNGTSWTTKTTTVTTDDKLRNASSQTTYTYSSVAVPNPPYDEQYFGDQIPVEQTVVYNDQNGATLRTENKSWFDQSKMTCSSITQDSSIARTDYAYSQYGAQVTDKKEWDWGQAPACGSSPSGTPRRETETAYQSFAATHAYSYGASIFDRPATVTVYGNGAETAQTTYAYDQAAVSGTSGVTGHDYTNYGSSYNNRGNATSKSQWLNTTNSDLTTTYTYDDTGQMLSMTDPCGNTSCGDMSGSSHTTYYSYTDSYATGSPPGPTNAYLSQIAYPNTGVAHVVKFSYNYADGQLASSTDQNNSPTSYTYSDPLDRLTQIGYPDGGKTQYSYNDSPPSPSVTTTVAITSSENRVSTSIMDGVGHVVRTELQSDPAGTDYTDTTYDGEGRVWKGSNPYRSTSDPTYGLTTTAYDALGRVTSITRPDGSIASTSYSGNCSTATDEAAKSRETCSDGLGRMTAVDEDPGGLGYQTTYTYDALDNLLTAVDGGQTRSFTYDSLSRLLSATNPESGTTTYTYDADGNVGTRTDARSVKTTYSYDALNRLTSKSYSDGTPTANYWYDYNWAGFGNWRQGSLTNTKGRLDATCTSNAVAACPAGYTGTVYSYDPMGRIVNYWQATPYDEGTSAWETTYNYDLAGDVTSWTHPAGFTITNTINAAQEITQIESSLADPGHPQYLAKNITYTPWGAEATLENGCASTYGQEIGCTDMLETYAYNNRMQPVIIELGNTSNASANYCLVYNYFAGAANPTSCAMPGQGKNDNGGVGGYVYLDNQTTLSPNLSYTAAFQYDAVNRLMNAQGTGVSPYNLPLSYTADGSGGRYGNVTCAVNAQTQGLCPQYTFNGANNEITTSGFSYDAAGELTDDPSNSPGEAYTWDGAGRLVTITQGADTYANNTYSAQGWQVENVWPIYGNMGQENMYDPTGRELGHVDTANRRWWDADVWADGRMIAQWSTAGTHFLHANSQGTDTQVTNAAGSVTLDMEYDAWGRVPTHTGNMNDGHYAGMEQSAGILYGTPTRQYSSPLGRWLTPDPAGMDAVDLSNPQSWNMYAYALNNPTTNTDPTGLYCTRDSNGNLVDVGNEGESCADVEASNEAEEKNPSVVVRGKPGNVVETVAANAFLSLDNVANDFFAPFIGMRPSYMQDTPTGSGTAANIGALVGIVGSALIGPEGEAEDGISIAEGRLTKVLEAHTAGGLLSAGKSLFDNPDEVRGLIQAARSAPAIEQSGRFAGKFERVVDAGRIIGTDRTGARTSIYTVITDSNGHLVTAFPGRP